MTDLLCKTALLLHESFPHSSVQAIGGNLAEEIVRAQAPGSCRAGLGARCAARLRVLPADRGRLRTRTTAFSRKQRLRSAADRLRPATAARGGGRAPAPARDAGPAALSPSATCRSRERSRSPAPRTPAAPWSRGATRRTSVVDAEGKVHGLENCYVVDGSVLPRSSRVNPALTIYAWALRVASRLGARGPANERMHCQTRSGSGVRSAATSPQAERREWWLANGRGGYAAGTIAGTLTRRYHGLLIAPVNPPLGRHLVFAKADATLLDGEREWPLFTNRWGERGGRAARLPADGVVPPRRPHPGVAVRRATRCASSTASGWSTARTRLTRPGACAVAYPRVALRLNVKLLVNARDFHGTTRPWDFNPVIEGHGAELRVAASELVHPDGARQRRRDRDAPRLVSRTSICRSSASADFRTATATSVSARRRSSSAATRGAASSRVCCPSRRSTWKRRCGARRRTIWEYCAGRR